MDSNELPEGWRENVLIENVNKNRAWNKAKDDIRDWNMEHEDALMEINNINRNDQEVDDLENQSLPSDDDMENIWRKKIKQNGKEEIFQKGLLHIQQKNFLKFFLEKQKVAWMEHLNPAVSYGSNYLFVWSKLVVFGFLLYGVCCMINLK